jgi:uncharacterized protein (DUF427 family)
MKDGEHREARESVWDYPRPPRVEPSRRHIRVEFNGIAIADTRQALRVLETSHPPAYYIPPRDVKLRHLVAEEKRTVCEFKGVASYYTLKTNNKVSRNAAWSYHQPAPGYEALKDHIAFYPTLVDACYVDGERVGAQEGDFYGGWITSDIAGPFKGAPGTESW